MTIPQTIAHRISTPVPFTFLNLRITSEYVSRPIRGGPLEKLSGETEIFEPQEFFRYQIPCMNFCKAIAMNIF